LFSIPAASSVKELSEFNVRVPGEHPQHSILVAGIRASGLLLFSYHQKGCQGTELMNREIGMRTGLVLPVWDVHALLS
jgi:hypothetical protein